MKRVLTNYVLILLSGFFTLVSLQGCESKPSAKQSNKTKATHFLNKESIYKSAGRWDNQYGDTIQLSELAGKIPVVSMIFTRCPIACPRIVADMEAIKKQVPEDKKDKVIFVLVSFDSDRDHTLELKEFAKRMNLNDQWLILHGNENAVKELSKLLGSRYKKQPTGDYSHSSEITLLDTKGVIAAQIKGLGVDAKAVVEGIEEL
jgi:protein SCO1